MKTMLVWKRCWWCGFTAEVDPEVPVSNGLTRDSETSWICAGECRLERY